MKKAQYYKLVSRISGKRGYFSSLIRDPKSIVAYSHFTWTHGRYLTVFESYAHVESQISQNTIFYEKGEHFLFKALIVPEEAQALQKIRYALTFAGRFTTSMQSGWPDGTVFAKSVKLYGPPLPLPILL